MNFKSFIQSILVLPALVVSAMTSWTSLAQSPPLTEKSVLDFTMRDIDSKEVPLSQYRGNVLLIVNVASRCGFTPQYEGLEKVYQRFRKQGFLVLGFPANNFLSQEPGTNEEIKQFCQSTYNVTFPLFSKISVRGDDQHPLYRFLTSKETVGEFAGAIQWNFQKFLVDREGRVVARFAPSDKPESAEVIAMIEKTLSQGDAGVQDNTRSR